jgi:hypothetical protein
MRRSYQEKSGGKPAFPTPSFTQLRPTADLRGIPSERIGRVRKSRGREGRLAPALGIGLFLLRESKDDNQVTQTFERGPVYHRTGLSSYFSSNPGNWRRSAEERCARARTFHFHYPRTQIHAVSIATPPATFHARVTTDTFIFRTCAEVLMEKASMDRNAALATRSKMSRD